MFAEDTAVVIMNGSREQQGKIMKTNQGIFKLFGYSMFEVQGHDVNILMPPVIASKHQFFLENYFKTGKETILNSCLESFAMYRTGTIFPVHLVVKPVPSLRNDI
jgi:PAS domain S-box-containing protein